MPKIKSSLFSADGKLISPSASSTAESGKQIVDKELAALRKSGVKQSVFSEDDKLLEQPRKVCSESTADKLVKLINHRVHHLTAQLAKTRDSPEVEQSLETQIWFLQDQATKVPCMSKADQAQLSDMIVEEENKLPVVELKEKLRAPDLEDDSPMRARPDVGEKKSAPIILVETVMEERAPPSPGVVAQKPPAPVTPAPTPPPKNEATAVPASVADAVTTPTKSSLKNTNKYPTPNQKVQIADQDSSIPSSERPSLVQLRSMSFNNLDDLDDLLLGGDVEEQEEELLAWSTQGAHHLSDWKIIVDESNNKTTITYHVHKLVLSTGPTKAEHFERRFMAGGQGNETHVELSMSAADAMPQLLDFMYSRQDDLILNTRNAVGLRHLGKLYGIRKLVVLVTTFLRQDLKAPTGLHYLCAAAEFQDLTVMTRASEVCAANIMTLDRDLLTSLEAPLFSMVVACDKVACSSEELSKIVGEFCRKKEDKMSHDLLQAITSSKNMPTVDCSESVYLLSLSERHEKVDAKSDLESRCILSGSTAWSGTLVGQLKQFPDSAGPYDLLSAKLKVKLLEDALVKAKTDTSHFDSQKADISAEQDARLKEAIAHKDAELSNFFKQAKELQSHAALCKRELANFQRIPASLKGSKIASAYNPSGGKHEKQKPSAMPPSAQENDLLGCLYPQDMGLWPMYYYKNA